MIGIGVDAVDIERFRDVIARRPNIVGKLFTGTEQSYCAQQRDSTASLAVRFAAKEATMKAMGVGLGAFGFHDVSVTRADSGAPGLLITGKAAELARQRGISTWHVSLSHTAIVATAVVVAE